MSWPARRRVVRRLRDLGRSPVPEPPAGLAERIKSAIPADLALPGLEEPPPEPATLGLPRRWRPHRWRIAAALAMAVTTGSLAWWLREERGAEAPAGRAVAREEARARAGRAGEAAGAATGGAGEASTAATGPGPVGGVVAERRPAPGPAPAPPAAGLDARRAPRALADEASPAPPAGRRQAGGAPGAARNEEVEGGEGVAAQALAAAPQRPAVPEPPPSPPASRPADDRSAFGESIAAAPRPVEPVAVPEALPALAEEVTVQEAAPRREPVPRPAPPAAARAAPAPRREEAKRVEAESADAYRDAATGPAGAEAGTGERRREDAAARIAAGEPRAETGLLAELIRTAPEAGLEYGTGAVDRVRRDLAAGRWPPPGAVDVQGFVDGLAGGEPPAAAARRAGAPVGEIVVAADGGPAPWVDGARRWLLRFHLRGGDPAGGAAVVGGEGPSPPARIEVRFAGDRVASARRVGAEGTVAGGGEGLRDELAIAAARLDAGVTLLYRVELRGAVEAGGAPLAALTVRRPSPAGGESAVTGALRPSALAASWEAASPAFRLAAAAAALAEALARPGGAPPADAADLAALALRADRLAAGDFAGDPRVAELARLAALAARLAAR